MHFFLVEQASQAAEKLAPCHSEGGVCPRNLLFLGSPEEKQIPRFARDDKNFFFRSQFSQFALM